MRKSTPPDVRAPRDTASATVELEDVPFGRFHLHVAVAGSGGQFSDGYILGIIGIALTSATDDLALNAVWLGLLGAASLAGLFFGSLFSGALIDRIGRHPIFAFDMPLLAALSLAQFWTAAAWQLLLLRLLLGLVLGADYAASKTLVSELAPRKSRGRMMSVLAIAWAAGYTIAYLVGYLIAQTASGGRPWTWMLASSAVPALLVAAARLGVPESPRWLIAKGRAQEAAAMIAAKIGPHVTLPTAPAPAPATSSGAPAESGSLRALFAPALRSRTVIACVFYLCHIMPYFALSTFSPRILASLGVHNAYFGGAVYNLLLLVGAVVGMSVIDRLTRRRFLVGSFAVAAVLLLPLGILHDLPITLVIVLFAALAFALSAADTLAFVYPQELFPTRMRATGVGAAVAASRIGASISTFLLPVVVESFGIRTAMTGLVLVLAAGALACYRYAPETSGLKLGSQ
ncbi:MFS transporter [Streptomyces malaysiensis]|uniref:MFS transporter n=1 Tax=Streptomyces TaxID=1883 RepID=UPI001E48DFAB|nr:MFS transporter [Streptomyces sp. HNM0561]UHH21066.1 MFS transporter [Streptomyces sp. HNM0561]